MSASETTAPVVHEQFCLPDVGEGLTEAEVLRWLVAPGDVVADGDVVVEIETAKAAVELPCPLAGTVVSLDVAEGAVLDVGAPLLTVAITARPPSTVAPTSVEEPAEEEVSGPVLVGYGITGPTARRRRLRALPATPATPEPEVAPAGTPARALAKPPVRRLARDLGIDLARVAASGAGGTVTRADVERAAAQDVRRVAAPAVSSGDERIPVRGVLRAMSDAMVRSAFTAPHASLFMDVDASAAQQFVQRMREHPDFAPHRPTLLALATAGLLRAVRAQPLLNATFDAEAHEIVVHRDVNVGIAVASGRGLLVPNLKAAQDRDLPELVAGVADLVRTARGGAATPADLSGGTITLTNVGSLGVDGGTPILNPGETAILALGRAVDRPWVVEGRVEVRPVVHLVLAFDHRVLDGAAAAAGLSALVEFLADPATALALG